MNEGKTWLGHLVCFTIYAIFGFNIIICKDIATSDILSPYALFLFRSVIAGVLFWLTSLFFPKEKVEKRDLPRIFMASILGFFLTQITFLMGIPHITPMDCSIIVSLSPIFTMFVAAVVLKEPITVKKLSGVVISFAGIIYLIMNAVTMPGGVQVTQPAGLFLIVMNCLCFSTYLGIFKPLISKYSPLTFMKWIFLFSTVLSIPLAGEEVIHIDYSSMSWSYIGELSYLIFFATFIAYLLLPIGQKLIRPTLVSMYTYVQPIIATCISIYIGMDTLTWQKVLAAVMVFGGVVLVNRSRSAQTR